MSRLRPWILLALWFALAPAEILAQTGSGAAAPAPVALTVADAAAAVSEFDVNGMRVLIKRRPGSRTVAGGIFIRGGAATLTPETAGLEGLLLRVAAEGSVRFPRETLRRELARMATSISSGANNDYSALTLACTRANFERSWEIFTDLFLRPALRAEDLERERERLLTILRGRDDAPDAALEHLHERALFAAHAYRAEPEGTPETIARFTVADLRRRHGEILFGTRLVLVLVGDMDPAQLLARVRAAFARLPRGNFLAPGVAGVEFTAPKLEIVRRELPENYVRAAFAAPGIATQDYAALHVLVTILRSRIFEEVREKRSLSYAPDAFLMKLGANYGGLYVSAEDANQSVAVMLGEIARLRREQVEKSSIEDSIAQWATTFYQGQETSAAQAGTLALYELIGGGWRNAFTFSERLARVTPADVQRVALQYVRNLQFLVLGNPAQINREIFLGK